MIWTVPVEHWIGNAAAALSGVWGAVTRQAERSGYSRTTISKHAERVVQAVVNEQGSGISSERLWTENQRLQAENAALWQAWSATEDLREGKQRELVSAGSAMGLSLSQLVTLLAIVLPPWCGTKSGHGRALGAPECRAIEPHPQDT